MKYLLLLFTLAGSLFIFGCDVQSGITKKSVEKYEPTPTPEKVVIVQEPIDPADVVTVDTALDGPKISIIPTDNKTSVNCDKYNRVAINGDDRTIEIKGICKQIMINGSENQISAYAASEYVVNGDGNTIKWTKYVNGKNPIIADNADGNTIQRDETPPAGK